jgi:septal ring factor EnvC (AmiA/AmiB activator)
MNTFGAPREETGVQWKGLFIRSTTGEMVHAIADGRVVYADWLRGFGNLLILDHGGGYMSLYANNEGLVRQVGDTVRSGDTVAQVGSSGGHPESGLYFELRHDGKAFDPMKWIVF